MAKLNEDMVVIKVSELLKDSDDSRKILDQEIVNTIEAAVQEPHGIGVREASEGSCHVSRLILGTATILFRRVVQLLRRVFRMSP